MFFDWLTIEQDFGYQLPLLGDSAYQRLSIDQSTGEQTPLSFISQPTFKHRGSFCDVVSIQIRGSSIRMSGNPSRWDRLDNLFGFDTVDKCVSVFNKILLSLGLPVFTRVTRIFPSQSKECDSVSWSCDGAVIRELHITTNRSVGFDNENDYLKGLSTQPYRGSHARLHSNGKTVDWLSKTGKAHLIYPSVYNKNHEICLHLLPKILRKFGKNSDEYNYLKSVADYCLNFGVVRFEQKLKSRFLQKKGLNWWGYSDFSVLSDLQSKFLSLDERLLVTAMDFETISERLISSGVVPNVRAANTTANYALQWMHGQTFDISKSHIQTHRARLRKIGIDIAQTCNISLFSPVFVRSAREVVVSDCVIPDWYRRPVCHLSLVS